MKSTGSFAVCMLAGLVLTFGTAAGLNTSPSHPDTGVEGLAVREAPVESPGPVLRGPTDIKNLNTGEEFATIQDAIDDTDTVDGHILEVQVTPHSEGIVTVTKSLTIRGGGGAATILASTSTTSSGDGRGWFLVTVPNVTIKDLTFDGNGFLIWQGFRLKAGSDGALFDNCTFNDIRYQASGSPYSGNAMVAIDCSMTVRNCTLTNIGRHGIFFFGTGSTAGVAENNTYTGKGAGDWLDYGVEVGGGAVATLTNNTITNCRGVALSDGSTSAGMLITTFFGAGTTGDLTGNFLNANTTGCFVGYDAADVAVVTAGDNDLSGNDTNAMVGTSSTVRTDASGNWWGSNVGATVAAGLSGDIDYTPWLDVGTDTNLGTDGFQGDFSTLNVDDDSPQSGATGRVQEAIGLVTASTINVAAGTYSANLILNKSVTLLGARAGVDACGRVVGPPNPAVESVLTAASGKILTLQGGCAGSTIDGFAFFGAARGIESTSGPIDNVNILNNHFSGQTGSAMFLNDNGIDLDIDQNEFDGTAGTSTLVHFDQDNFDGLHFTNNCVLNRTSGTGFFVDGNHNIGVSTRAPLIDGNIFDNNQTGANLGRFAFELGAISDNEFTNSGFDGLQGGIQSSTISGNLFDSNGRYGLALTGFGGSGDPTRGAQNDVITGNTFTSNVTAGLLFSSSQFPGTISTNVANNNDIVGNTAGASYAGTETIDVSCNWWGDIGGPDAAANPNPPGDDIVGTTLVYWAWLDAPIPGGVCNQYGGNNIAADPSGICISTVDTCVSVPVVFNRTDTANARGASVTIQLSSELELCGSITQGSWLTGLTNFQVVDNGGGSYTIDQAILGLPCGVITGGTLFDVPVQKTSGVTTDSTGTITVTSVIVRDCTNQPLPGIPGAPATIPIDLTSPTGVADLTAIQDKGGNGTDGRTDIDLTFTAPVDADSVMVFRKAYGDYPEYNDGTGAVPSVPTSPANAVANGWTLTGVTLSGQGDEPATRDFWYYVLFTEDACNNVSAASNMTGGTLNYHLGDVSNGVTNGQGDNLVGPPDVSLLGAHYGVTLVFGDSVNYLDVGPTTDFSVDALPTTDNQVGFEDLMMFAINYNQVSRSGPDAIASVPSDVAERPVLALAVDRGSGLTARLVLRDHEAAVKGVHAVVSYDRDALELLGVSRGGLFDEQGGPVFFETLDREEGLVVDAAILGRDLTFAGSGEVAVLTFREKKPGAALKLATADLRGVDNRFFGERPVTAGATAPAAAPVVSGPALPTELELVGARPNPFDRATDIVFRLPESRSVSVRVYDVGGRLVRTLVDRALPAGEHRTTWDGRDGLGRTASAGIYFYTFRAGDHRETQKLLHVR